MVTGAEADMERASLYEEKRAIKSDHDEGADYHAERAVKQGIAYDVRGDYASRAACRFFVERIDVDSILDYIMSESDHGTNDSLISALERAVQTDGSADALQALFLQQAEEMVKKAFDVERTYMGL